jgi:integrase
MTHAAEKIGMKRVTHHDLRHLFATIWAESGVDIPTVSRWLGHKDGGALVPNIRTPIRTRNLI